MGQGRTFSLPGTMLSAVGEYTVKAQALSSLGFGKSSKNEFDEWHFKVSENDVVSCSLNATAKVGKTILITPKYIFKDKLPAEK